MRPVEHSDIVKIDIFIAQFENPLRHKLRLLRAIIQRYQSRLQQLLIRV
jgi:hypothetical protein